jgi:glycosyltransferase 2 family protein
MTTVDHQQSASDVIVRSPADILRLVVAAVVLVILLLVEWLFGDTLVTFFSQLLSGFAALPQWIIDTVAIGTRVLSLAVLVAGLIFTMVKSGWKMVTTVVVAVAIAAILVPLLSNVADVPEGSQVIDISVNLGPLTDPTSPTAVGVGIFAAALTAAAPWLSRLWRRWGWVAVIGVAWTRFITSPVSFDSFQAVVVGWVAGAAALVLLGAPSRRPTAEAISDGLERAGLPLTSLRAASVDARGSTPYFGEGPNGDRYFIKALGEDQRSADLLFRLYRTIKRRNLGDERPFSSLRRAVEHEAFVSLAARDLGVRTPRVRAMATAPPNAFVLAYDSVEGRSLDRLEPQEITDEVLAGIWGQIAELRAHRIAHRDLRLANLFLANDGQVWMIDFGFSELAASDLLLATDVAELVTSSSIVVGPERAVAPAIATVDAGTRAAAVDRLHPWALSGATRTALKEQPGLLDDLRARLV